ncbi:MAG: hypothetical protein JWN66_730 [Sphingomonas bacterium]|jgi:hypothetical protein|uniref:DUF4230 domain-containing protein n=1 Tax=Sphingomonas bacterium TaxID=1895847 RepID=UPI00263905A7|nr:DUF4230 domain-containing protein [Sphingomonas bacterium]MDB5703614.1 hypothetical protein [Sphingomonas bacterium]
MKFLGKFAGALALLALFIAGGFWALGYYVSGKMKGPDPVTIASASLQGLKEQNRLSAFAARFVSVTTSTQSQYGLSAKKTLIMPGMVRYEVDLAKLQQKDVTWDAGTRTLGVTLPPVEVSAPQIDLTQMREYGEGGILSAFTDADAKLQDANRRAGQQELVRQAHEAVPLNLARDATRRAVERSFSMPLKAAGMDVTVKVRFADEPKDNSEVWDTTRSLEEVLGNKH